MRGLIDCSRRYLAAFGLAVALACAAGPADAEVKEVRIGIGYGLVYLPVIVAEAQGYFAAEAKKAGLGDLTVTVRRLSGPPAFNDALLSGNIDAGAIGITGFLILWEKTRGRQDMRGLAALAAHPFVLFANKPDIKAFTDFGEQDKIAITAPTAPQAIIMRMAAERFYGPGQYARIDNLLVAMAHPDAVAALLAGQAGLTGYMGTPPFIATLRKSGKVRAVLTSRDILGPADATGVVLTVAAAFVDNNPGVAKVLIAAMEDAMAFIAADPEQAAAIYLQAEPAAKIGRDDVAEMLRDGTMTYAVTPTGIMQFARFMAKTQQLKAAPAAWQAGLGPWAQPPRRGWRNA